jgi:hypothetical protein
VQRETGETREILRNPVPSPRVRGEGQGEGQVPARPATGAPARTRHRRPSAKRTYIRVSFANFAMNFFEPTRSKYTVSFASGPEPSIVRIVPTPNWSCFTFWPRL